MTEAFPDQWRSKDAEVWEYPDDFNRATDLVKSGTV
jgi:hypothetical protein